MKSIWWKENEITLNEIMVCCFHSECTSVHGCLYSLCRVNNSHTGIHTHTHAGLKLCLLVGILSYHTLHMYVFSNVVLRLCLCAYNHTSGKSKDCYKIIARRFFEKKNHWVVGLNISCNMTHKKFKQMSKKCLVPYI